MDEVVAFLRARLDDVEAAALAAGPDEKARTWEASDNGYPDGGEVHDAYGRKVVYDEGAPDTAQAFHIALHDPESALREVKTWRKILVEYVIPSGTDAVYGGTERETGFRLALSFALKAKAAEWSGHPDYPVT